MNDRATFTRMEKSTKEDWGRIVPQAIQAFMPMMRRLMAKPKRSVYRAALKN